MGFLDAAIPSSSAKKPRNKTEKDPCKRIVPTAVLDRLLKNSQVYEEDWTKNRLYASSVCCDTYFDMNDELVKFWAPPEEKKKDYVSEARMKAGNTAHEILQKHWYSTGLTHPICTTGGKFKEPYGAFPDYAISGKIDLIIPTPEILKKIDKGVKDVKLDSWIVSDIKQTEAQYYKGASEKLRQSYRGQVSLYIKWFHEHHGGPEKKGSFWYLCRDTPKKHKLFAYEKEDSLIELAFKRGKEYINHISNRTFVNPEFTENWVTEQIDKWKEREEKYVKDGLIESGEKKLRNWPEYSGVNYKIKGI